MQIEPYIKAYEKLKEGRKAEPSWLRFMREETLGLFAEKGFPTMKDEAWRYTDISNVIDGGFLPKVQVAGITPENARVLKKGLNGYCLFMINGKFCPEVSDIPKTISVKNIPDVLAGDPKLRQHFRFLLMPKPEAFAELNVALGSGGVFIDIPEGENVDRPLYLIYQSNSQGGFCQSKTVLSLGKGAKAVFIEDFRGGSGEKYFTNAVTGVVLDEGAVLEHYKIQRESQDAGHVAHLNVELRKKSSFSSLSVATGAKLSRYEISVEIAGSDAACRLSGVYLGAGDQHFDHVTWVDHAKPSGKSDQLFKGVLGGSSCGVFTGRVLVRPGAQKTDARQTNKSLLLSETAKADARPQLEILADDVKCSHGAAVGQLEEDAIFYLRSRGIGERAAQKILAEGFAHEILDSISDVQWKNYLEKIISEKLINIGIGAA